MVETEEVLRRNRNDLTVSSNKMQPKCALEEHLIDPETIIVEK